MRYIVEITETLQKQIIVNAEDESKAIEMAKDIYYSEQEVLTAENYIDTKFEIIKEEQWEESII